VFWKLNQGLLKEAPVSEAHSVRISGQSCRFAVQSRALMIRNLHYNFIAVLLQSGMGRSRARSAAMILPRP
jgi:hypothetical protein